MVAQIPLPWQLADLISAMGLGFWYAAVYLLLCRMCRRRPSRPLPEGTVCVYGTPQQRRARARRQKKRRKAEAFVGQLLYAVLCCLFTRAWILTESRAAQFRGSMAVGIVLGWTVFCCRVLPVLRRAEKRLCRLGAPAVRLLRRCRDARATRAQAAREKRRLRYEQRMQRRKARLQQRPAAEKVKKPSEQNRKSRKEFEKNEQKQLQTAARVYYNNL